MRAGRAAGPGLLRPLAVRDFRLLWTGQTVSLLGDGLLTVALPWQALQLSPHPATLALVLLARAGPRSLLLLFAGVVTDRVSRRRLMLAADAVQGLAVGVLALLAAAGQLRLWQLVALAAVNGAAGAFFFPASTALLPALVPAVLLLPANALHSSSRLLAAQLAGPALGGLLVAAAGTAWAFGLDALSFGASMATLAAMRVTETRAPGDARPGLLREVGEGLRFTRSLPWLWVSLLLAAAVNLLVGGPLGPTVPLLARDGLGTGAGGLGLLWAGYGVGGALAVLLAGQAGTPGRPVVALYGAWGLTGLATAGLGLAPGLGVAVGLFAAAGFLAELSNLLWTTLVQQQVPARVLGRVSSVDWLLSLSLLPLGIAAAGPAATAVGARAVLVGGGLASAVLVGAVLLLPGVREPDRAAGGPGPDQRLRLRRGRR
jgi:hypothetical protein